MRDNDIRAGEKAIDWPDATDAGLIFIGRIRTPWTSRLDCPRQGQPDGPLCRIDIFEPWREALQGIEGFERIEVLYWLHLSRRDLILQSPRKDGTTRGAFALRSPLRPNPIGTSLVTLTGVADGALLVRGLDCFDGTPLIDIKPDRCPFTPLALQVPGDAEASEKDR